MAQLGMPARARDRMGALPPWSIGAGESPGALELEGPGAGGVLEATPARPADGARRPPLALDGVRD